MAWKVTFPTGETVNFDDLPPSVFAEVAKDDATATWYGVYLMPQNDVERMQRILVKCAEHAGIAAPDEPATTGEAAARMEWFTQTENVGDKAYMNGFPQTPNEPETGSTSGSLGDSTGPQTSSTDSPSEDS